MTVIRQDLWPGRNVIAIYQKRAANLATIAFEHIIKKRQLRLAQGLALGQALLGLECIETLHKERRAGVCYRPERRQHPLRTAFLRQGGEPLYFSPLGILATDSRLARG